VETIWYINPRPISPTMMHPARQAYVEEDDPEVNYSQKMPHSLSFVHMIVQRKADVEWAIRGHPGKEAEFWLMGWFHVLGYGDGGGPREYP
jgi:hypothetical protein